MAICRFAAASTLALLLYCIFVRCAAGELPFLGEHYYQIGDWKRAAQAYEEEVLRSHSLEARRRLAESYYHLGQYESAQKVLDESLRETDDLPFRILGILIRAKRGEADEALEELKGMLQRGAPPGEIYTAMGTVELERDYDKALVDFRRAIEDNPRNFWAWFYTGTIYEDREILNDAMKAYKRALEINPKYAQAVNNLGYCFKEMHFYAYAVEQYERAIELLPDKADFYYNVGNAYTLSNMIDEALNAYSTAVELEPTFAKAHYNLGRTLVRKERYEEAVREFQLYLKYANTYILRQVASERSVRDEIEKIEHYLKLYNE